MGRTLKRVPLDFAWPRDKVWEGYVNPYWSRRINCGQCGKTGYSPKARRFYNEWYGDVEFDAAAYGATPLQLDNPALVARVLHNQPGIPDVELDEVRLRMWELYKNKWSAHLIQADVDALLAKGRLMDFTRVPLNEEQREIVRQKVANGGNSWLPETNGYTPSAQEVNDWSIANIGHDAINFWICLEARCEREGVEKTCSACSGHGYIWPTQEDQELYDNWESQEPPSGDGYQLWETTSEGSPVSPVFKTLWRLCEWCAVNATTFGSFKASAEEWEKMLNDDHVYHRSGNLVFM